MGLSQHNGISQHRVSRQQPCPVCQKTHGCLLYDSHVVCLRVVSDHPAHGGLGGWRHSLHEPHLFQAALQTFMQPSQRLAPADTLDKVYRSMHSNLYLNASHTKHLTQERQLSGEAIQRRGYQSWGQGDRMLRSRLAEILHDLHGGIVLDVPGFLLRDQGRAYLTLGGPAGILIPVQNADGQIVAHQIRTDTPSKSGKYVWLSSTSRGGPGPGSPVHVARPLSPLPTPSGRVWLTEGPLKADIACDRLHEVVLALPGAQADKHFLATLQRLQERGEVKELIIALDSDHHEKPAIARARLKLAEIAARHGIPVSLADWAPSLKGLDDLLLAGGQPKLTPYQVSGNGKRPMEEVPAPPKSPQKTVGLQQSRDSMATTVHQALDGELGEPKTLALLISCLPGSGKSTILTNVLNKYHGSRSPRRSSAYFVPRHDLADSPNRDSWACMGGRTHQDPESGETPCAFPERQKELSRLQIPGQMGCDHCPLYQACKENARPGQEQPYYLGQFQQKAKVRLFPSQHFLSPSLWARPTAPTAVILDDCDLKSLMLEELILPQTQLGFALDWAEKNLEHAYAKAQPLLFLLYEMLRAAPAGAAFCWDGVFLMSQFEALAQVHKLALEEVLLDARQAEEPDPFLDRTLPEGPRAVPVRFLDKLLDVLWHEWQEHQSQKPYNRRLRLERVSPGQEAGLRLTMRRDLPLEALSNSLLIVADASLSLAEAQRLEPNRRWIELKPALKIPAAAKIIQYTGCNWGKVHLSKPKEQKKALELIGEIVRRHPFEKISLITHQSFASIVRQHFPQLKLGHYYGQRGSNDFEHCTVHITFGTPNPNPNDTLRLAEALYWDQKILRPQTMLEPKLFLQPGQTAIQTRVRSYADERLNEWLQAKRDEELLQAIFRARPLSLDPANHTQLEFDFLTDPNAPQARKSVNIYIFSSTPLNLEVELHRQTAPADSEEKQANVVVFREASQRIWRARQRLTNQRLAESANTQRSSVLRWKRNRLGYEVESASPPGQAPPNLQELPAELIANLF